MPPSKERREKLNKIYVLYAWRYRSQNKTNYGPLCFHALYMYENLTEPLQDLWCEVYNASMKGHPGRNMGLDQLMEKINLAAKMLLEGAATDDRITAVLPEINVVHRVELVHDIVLRSNNFNPRKTGKPDLEPDVAMMLRMLHTCLPWRIANWPQASDINALTGRKIGLGERAWEMIKSGQADWRDYASRKLTQFSFAAPSV